MTFMPVPTVKDGEHFTASAFNQYVRGTLDKIYRSAQNLSERLLDTVELTSPAASISLAVPSIPDLPSSYFFTRIQVFGRGSSADANEILYARFNGDSGANYNHNSCRFTATTGTVFGGYGQTAARIGSLPCEGSREGSAGYVEVLIPGASILDYRKVGIATAGWIEFAGGIDVQLRFGGFAWASTSPITSVLLYLDQGNFLAGSYAQLFGMDYF